MTYRSLWRRLRARSRRPHRHAPSLAIFMYHSVVRRPLEVDEVCFIREEEFSRQLDALRQRFRLVSLEEGARRLGGGELGEPTAVLTFDDGFQDNFEVVYPLLQAAGAPATIFLCTDLLDTERAPWYCRLHEALTRTTDQKLDWSGRCYDLGDARARARAAARLKTELKRLPHPEVEAAVVAIEDRLALPERSDRRPDPRFRVLSREAAREMSRSGLVELGAHTGSHAILARLSRAEQKSEIERSIREVSALVDKPCRLFAYPNGSFDDYDATTIELLRDAGITVAVTAEAGWNDADTPSLELLRFPVVGEPSMPRFERVLDRSARSLRAR